MNMKLKKKQLKPLEDVIKALSEQYPGTSFSFEIRNFCKERLPDFAIYASDNWVKPCGSCHCNCGNTKQGGRKRFLEEINEMLSNKIKTKKAQKAAKQKLIDEKKDEIERLKEDIKRLVY